MTSEEKKVYLLLKSVIFHYHGLDEEERQGILESADEIDGREELKWVNEFISQDYFNSFERAREYLNDIVGDYPLDKRIFYIEMVWKANSKKGYVTELEATAMLKLARDWNVEAELIEIIKKMSQS
ncbi:hypothetical protein C900_04583 [Fulvivirga imtechensis AK7]|uniref:Co-chaperone DjlA N-terminal domain-containing protein n=1 Tax=Fulvivirga imtechensis AK7 TaxID=1237149 RepID=L8JM45_9BACT|nr:hypothetical protein [Fulvivirga imtechensis]ELR69880.1 hypothetical protein C900_04583 [Fulvivirga imtechensis AK7]